MKRQPRPDTSTPEELGRDFAKYVAAGRRSDAIPVVPLEVLITASHSCQELIPWICLISYSNRVSFTSWKCGRKNQIDAAFQEKVRAINRSDKARANSKKYYAIYSADPEKKARLRKWARESYRRNRDSILARLRERWPSRKKHLMAQQKLYKAKFYNTPEQRFKRSLRGRIHKYLKVVAAVKLTCTRELIGCSVEHLRKHLEKQFKPGMSWENHGLRGWHVDHIIPCSAFDMKKKEDQFHCFHFSNLQPLWWKDNLRKGGAHTRKRLDHAVL